MKKIILFITLCLFVFSLVACNKDKTEKAETKNVSNTTQQETKEGKKEESAKSGEGKSEEEKQQGIDLTQYRPEVGTKKTFTDNGQLIFTEEIIAANDEYVQTLLQLGDNLTTQIYRWTKDEVTLIYEDVNLENPRQDILNSFEAIEKHETLLSNNPSEKTTWKLLENSGEEKVPAGNYQQVMIIQKTTDEVVDETTTYTRYYAPKQGLIKEEYKVTGENGFTAVSELSSIEK